MICSTCGATNRTGRKFCAQCASPLAVACPSCGAAIEVGEWAWAIREVGLARDRSPDVRLGAKPFIERLDATMSR